MSVTVSEENREEYFVIRNCMYQRTFPSFNTDTLLVLCAHSLKDENLVPTCEECIGIKCQNMRLRNENRV